MKKKLIIVGSVVLAGAISLYAINTMNKVSVSIKETTVDNVEDGGTIIEIEEKEAIPVEQEFPMDTPEHQIMGAIHGMAHQKVEAEKKWGFVPLTAERVERLIKVVKVNKEGYRHDNTYLNILKRWKNNDFSQVDSDHNAIWELQNGNVGRATGILSAEEEKEFIEMYYEVE
ncbi:MAG: DUF6241 domain-containing protein [Bacillota bacterium]